MNTPSDLSQYLYNNDPLCATEIATLKQRIAELKKTIDYHQTQLDLANSQLSQHRMLVSPWRRAPLEILTEIFSYIFPLKMTKQDMKQLVKYCLVCQKWYDAAKHASHLWKGLEVDLATTQPTSDGFSTWIRRSWRLPRSLSLSISSHSCKSGPETCQLMNPAVLKWFTDGPTLDSLCIRSYCSHSARCLKHLMDEIQSHQTNSKWRPWESIRCFRLHFADAPAPRGFGPFINFFNPSFFAHILPAITSLDLRLPRGTVQLAPAAIQLDIPMSILEQLTFFRFECDWDGTHLFSLLQHCHKLETLVIDYRGSYDSREYAWNDPNIAVMVKAETSGLHLPKLHTLRIRNAVPSEDGLADLALLRTPALVNLEVSFVHVIMLDSIGEGLAEFFRSKAKCGQNARTLRLQDAPVGKSDELADILCSFPDLTHLTLDHVLFNQDVFTKIAEMDCLKHLEVMELLPIIPYPFDPGFARRFAQERGIVLK